MSVRWYSVVVDCRDIARQARWWAQVLNYRIVHESDDEVAIVPPALLDEGTRSRVDRGAEGLVFVPVPEGKHVKNRLHVDLAPWADDDQAAEVQRLLELGATRADVGQPEDATFVVLADPEGNEFCVLNPRDE